MNRLKIESKKNIFSLEFTSFLVYIIQFAPFFFFSASVQFIRNNNNKKRAFIPCLEKKLGLDKRSIYLVLAVQFVHLRDWNIFSYLIVEEDGHF